MEAVPSEEAAAAPAEPELVEVWRPAGRHDERRPRHERHRHHHRAAPAAATDAPASEGEEKKEGSRHHRRDRHRDDRRKREDEGAQARGPREERGERPHQRFKGKGKFEGKRDRDRKDGNSNFRTFATSAPRERERVADPNSPFAKLAALKEQLGNRKD